MCSQNNFQKHFTYLGVPHYATVDSGRKVLLLLRAAGLSGVLFHDAVNYYYYVTSYIAEDVYGEVLE
jgi:hypothetical protein